MINKKAKTIKLNTNIIHVFFFLFLFLNTQTSFAQAGIYDETDIEFQTMFIEAQLEKAKGNTEKQISLLKTVLKRDKSSHAAYYELAKAYVDTEDYDSAEKNAKKSHQFDASNPYYLELLAEIHERREQFEKANETYQKLITLDANNFEYYDKIAFNQIVIGEPKKAISTLNQWQTQNGISALTSYKIFDIYNGLGQKDKALLELDKLSNAYPTNINYLAKKAKYLFFIGEKDMALEVYNKILEINPHDQEALLAVNLNKPNSGSANSSLVDLEQIMNNANISLDAKIKELIPYMSKMPLDKEANQMLKSISKKLTESYPSEAKSFAVRGDVLYYLGDFKGSEKAYSQAIKLDDKKYLVWDQWILNLWELGNYKKMETVSMDAIDFFPNKVNAYLYYSIASKKNMKNKQAIEMLEEASFISAENPKFLTIISIISNWINLDTLTEEQINLSVSKINDKKIIHALHFELLGDIYNHLSESTKSKTYWKNAIKLGANSSRLGKKIGV